MPSPIVYSTDWTVFCLIFFLLPYLVFKKFETYAINKKLPTLFAACSILIVGPTFGLFHQFTEVRELKKDGVWTQAIVIDEKKSDSKGYKGWLIKLSFTAKDGKHETVYENDEKNKYAIGDTVKIIYLADFPKIYELAYQWTDE
jgi:hypothetical protein